MKNKILLLISTWSLVMSPVFGQTFSELAGVPFTINTRDSESEEWLIGGLFEVDTRDRFEFSLSSNSVLENQGAGIEVGSFRSSSANTVSYSLVSGEGSSENASFTLSSEGVLSTAKALDYEQTQEYSIRVLATASGSIPTEKVFSIVVLDVDEGIPWPSFFPQIRSRRTDRVGLGSVDLSRGKKMSRRGWSVGLNLAVTLKIPYQMAIQENRKARV